MKIPKSGIKNALFGCFGARIFRKLLSYLKSALSNLSICKILRKKIQTVSIWDQKCLICAFSARILKIIVIFLIRTLEFISKKETCEKHSKRFQSYTLKSLV